jgi:Zn finger protein HypA/HybF involved in hydrogenase expression
MGFKVLTCFQCKHTWTTMRGPTVCPKCGSKEWNIPKSNKLIT